MFPFLLACSLFSAFAGAASLLRRSPKAAPLHSLGYADDPLGPQVHWFDELDDPEKLFICRDYAEACFEAPAARRDPSTVQQQP